MGWFDFLLLGLGQPVLLGYAFRNLVRFLYILLVYECCLIIKLGIQERSRYNFATHSHDLF